MGGSAAELRFALPNPVETLRLLPGAEHWRESFEQSGLEIRAEGAVDLVIAPARLAAEAASIGAPSVLLQGFGGARKLRRQGYATARYLPIPSIFEPSVLVPFRSRHVSRYALENLSVPGDIVKIVRNRLLAIAAGIGIPLPGTIVLASRKPDLPFFVQRGQEVGLPDRLDWLFSLGRSFERSAFLLFETGASRPSWILKFSPDSSSPDAFLGDKRGLELVARLGEPLVEHVPRLVGISDGDLPLTVETAALGAPIVYLLRTPGHGKRKRALIEAVAHWLIEAGVTSARPGGIAGALGELVFPDGLAAELGVDPSELMQGLETLPSVLEHHDFASTHVLVDGESFTIIDWEEARAEGLPLTDLAFFLAHVLPSLDGELDDPAYGRREAFARLFRGESSSSPLLFEMLREAAARLEIPLEAVGPLLSLMWLRVSEGPRRHLAEVWFSDPALGPAWSPR
jgi:hypothetical protein